MERNQIDGIEVSLPRLIQGTQIPIMRLERRSDAFRLLDEVLESGCTAFDTARTYQDGESEQVLGQWIEARGVRDEIVIIGKGGHPRQGVSRVTPKALEEDLAESLSVLAVSNMDLYMLHRDDPNIPVEAIIDYLAEQARSGRITAYAASNWSVDRLQEANEYAESIGEHGFAANSVHFSLAVPQTPPWPGSRSIAGPAFAEDRRWYETTGLPVLAWSTLSHGFLTGRFRRDNLDTFDDPWDRVVIDAFCTEGNFERLDRARELAEQLGLSLPQIAVAYALGVRMNLFALVGCWTGDEYRALASASHVRLDPQAIRWLETG